ncbi:lipopolysaccharide-induced tumor necrosis factor-alpha factor-like isoform X2 [Vespa mandarinia]|nr:lipopolysaccharide-induced tumor necrosis factor-alpha factor-like isoform X2 [Vespa mandarinia]XP_035740316.1 lipopolysaccharide-induced tumor necrosis factor-alpha factor-like isoform X2 [Vespa mandarinia]XP_046831009.1 lipopolysaccharide-induced tumor necrosis factor-alpha factor-like [Vespa crabro]XP_047361347.1 lipopolysaccharide-induced tumor necrosis factor-alpha factor-like [Vespa velutina]XP_047361348.1 lipopolysaccharide-induced tumor necrosis factor-alpha factor-like [Vespa veluti
MEKATGSGGSNMEPSAPMQASLPTGPPSYEEAIAYGGGLPNPPYPVGVSPMPVPPTYNQPPKQTTMPMPSNYVVPNDHSASQPFNTDQNFAPPPEVRIIHQHVTFALGPHAIKMTCPTCHADIKTTTISDHQPSAHICCIVLCLLGCCLCSCLPYCMSAFMSVHHFCPNCKNYIGTWKG